MKIVHGEIVTVMNILFAIFNHIRPELDIQN
jgi:hypothetical protein